MKGEASVQNATSSPIIPQLYALENKNNPLVQLSLDRCDYVQSAGRSRADSDQCLPVPREAGQVREWQEAGSRNVLWEE